MFSPLKYGAFAILLLFCLAAFPQEVKSGASAQTKAKKQLSGLKLPPATGNEGEAKNSFLDGNYRAALSEYLAFLDKDPKNPMYLYRIAVSYLNGNIDYAKAEKYFEKAIASGSTEKDIYYQYARCMHLNYKFDSAIKYYEKGMELTKDKNLELKAKRNLEMCQNAKALIKKPVNVTIENLGDDINSPEPDYYPFIDENETFLIFSTRRTKGNAGYQTSDGFFTSDIFISYEKDGKWQKAKSLGLAVNTADDEEIVGLSNNGEQIFINLDSPVISGDVLFSERKGKNYQPPVQLPTPVNTEFLDITAFTNEDKQVVYFASDRPGGFGGTDLYLSRKLPNGEWSPAVNLGDNVNTEYNEFFPMLSKDGKTLYFSSEGHNSMGGFDIFKSEWSEKDTAWKKPVNIGYPINTPDDDMQICFNGDGSMAYLSSFRKGSIGDLDIYSVKFHDVDAKPSVIKAKVVKKIPIDYTDYTTFHIYEKNGIQKKFPESYLPTDPAWVFKEKKEVALKPGHRFSVFVTLEKGGESKKFALDKIPKDDSHNFKDIAISEVPIPDYKPPKNRPSYSTEIVSEAFISISVKSTGALHGDYLPNPNTGKFILNLPPGDYTINVSADGYKEHTENISIVGKASFVEELDKTIVLKPTKEPAPIHYSKLKKE